MKPKLRLVRPDETADEPNADAKPDIVAVLLDAADHVAAGNETAIAEAPLMLRSAASLIALMRTRRKS